MDLISIVLIAIGLAMDAFAVSVSCGVCVNYGRYVIAFKSAFMFGFFQWGMLSLGWVAGFAFRAYIEPVDHWIAFILLALIGGKMWKESMDENGTPIDLTGFKMLLALALATSIDAFAAGIGISALGYHIFIPSIYVGVITFILSLLGVLLGCKMAQYARYRKYLDRLGAVILIGIGIKILVEHLY